MIAASMDGGATVNTKQLWTAGLLLGLGLGGFFDGTVFHQILQWHHMICTTATCHPTSIADLQHKNFTDGLFHAACWVLCIAGVLALPPMPGLRRPGVVLVALVICGWGIFNL